MSLKIKYLNNKNSSSKNKAIFLTKESKISDFKGIFDDKINQKIIRFLKNSIKANENKIYVIPNAADESIFYKINKIKAKKDLKLLKNKKYILFVGSLTYRKGFDLFLKLAKKFQNYIFIFGFI